ncbi:hypothetical protein LEMLEM_LOCUS621 [Lemmus lemmus]
MQMPSLKPFLHRRKTKTKTLSRYICAAPNLGQKAYCHS